MLERTPTSDRDIRPFVVEMAASQMELTANIVTLLASSEHRALSRMHGVAAYMRDVGVALSRLRRSLEAICLDAKVEAMRPLLQRHAPLPEFVRGLYAWSAAVLRALDELGVEAQHRAPDWRRVSRRIHEANAFHFHELELPIRRQWAQWRRIAMASPQRLGVSKVGTIAVHLDELFSAADSAARRAEPPTPRARVRSFGRWLADGLVKRRTIDPWVPPSAAVTPRLRAEAKAEAPRIELVF